MAEKTTEIAPQQRETMSRRQPVSNSPFRMLERFAADIDGLFENFGLGRSTLSQRDRGWRPISSQGMEVWAPDVEVSQQNNELIVRADLPGMNKDDVSIDVTDDAIAISGERRQEQQTERGGIYRSERSYGSFYRTIPLPEGALVDQAKATFKDGVLEIRMPAPPEQVTRGRRLAIKDESNSNK